MKTVFKYQFMANYNSIAVDFICPFRIVYVGQQDDHVTVWVETSGEGGDASSTRKLRLAYFSTGQAIPEDAVHAGTVQMPSGLVWHVYEVK